jgi:alpha-galactosidase
MKFGLWVEPEMINPDSDLYRQHPDWVLPFPGRPRTQARYQLILEFGRPEVVEHIFGVLDALVDRHVTRRVTTLNLRFDVAMRGALGIGSSLNELSEAELAEYVSHIAFYKRLRAVIQSISLSIPATAAPSN